MAAPDIVDRIVAGLSDGVLARWACWRACDHPRSEHAGPIAGLLRAALGETSAPSPDLRLQVEAHTNVGIWLYGGADELADDAIVKLTDGIGRPITHVNAGWLKQLHELGAFGDDEPRQPPTWAPGGAS